MSEPPSDRILAWACELGFAEMYPDGGSGWDMALISVTDMHRFARLASAWGYEQGAAAERERCAELCEERAAAMAGDGRLERAEEDRHLAERIRALDPAPEPRPIVMPEGTNATPFNPIMVLRQDGTRVPLDELLTEYDALKLAAAQTEHKGNREP